MPELGIPERRGSRFALEVLFLLALMGALMLSDLRPLPIAGVMAAGWLLAAAFEWAASRNEAHYGSGLPPRYYVPQVSLPPARPLEQVGGYPEQRDEAPTWIASAAMREELLGEWPVASYADDVEIEPPAAGETTEDAAPEAGASDGTALEAAGSTDTGSTDTASKEAQPAELVAASEAEPVAEAARPAEPEPEPELELEPDTAERADVSPELTDLSGEPAADAPAAAATGFGRRLRFWRNGTASDELTDLPTEAELPVDLAADDEQTSERSLGAAPAGVTARHSLDPLTEHGRGRHAWRRGDDPEPATVEVAARPAAVRALPQHAALARDDGER